MNTDQNMLIKTKVKYYFYMPYREHLENNDVQWFRECGRTSILILKVGYKLNNLFKKEIHNINQDH